MEMETNNLQGIYLWTYKGIGQHFKMEDLTFLETQILSPLINVFKAVWMFYEMQIYFIVKEECLPHKTV